MNGDGAHPDSIPSETTAANAGVADRPAPARRGLSPGLQAGIVLAILALVAGVASILWQPGETTPGDTSAEAGFSRDMAEHHAQAVDMALIIRDRTEDEALRQFTIDIALTQQSQIGMMSGWLQLWGLRPTGSEPSMAWMGHNHSATGLMPGMATTQQLADLRTLPIDEAEVSFLRLMIAHHLGGVDMARALLARSDNEVVTRLAQSIIDGQQAEIDLMNLWLAQRTGS